MRATPDDERKLCNSCLLREEKRTITKEDKMSGTIDILIKCPIEEQRKIEEICMNQGIDFTKYFLDLHRVNTVFERERERLEKSEEPEKIEEISTVSNKQKKGGKK
jgi:hypothetical protein